MTEANEQFPPTGHPNLHPYSIKEPNEFTGRDFEQYKAFLFLQEEDNIQSVEDIERAGFRHFTPRIGENFDITLEDVKSVFNGVDGFFHRGARILDIGSGSGTAVVEMNRQFSSREVKVIGLDMEYKRERPLNDNPDIFIAGSWANMPFPDNYFTGLLAVQSFGRYDHSEKTIKEITRVSKQNAILRIDSITKDIDTAKALVDALDSKDKVDKSSTREEEFIHKMIENGWELYFHPRLTVAKLIEK